MEGDAQRGATLFQQATIGSSSAPGCVTCHALEPDLRLVGPSVAGVAGRAAERVADQSAEDYLWTSITQPDAYVVETYGSGLMYPNYGRDLTDQQIAALVAYMLTLDS
jgi:nitric oxide reductase subunit C